jgi:hypothetical protein
MAEVFVYSGGLGDAGIGSPQFIAAVSLLPSVPLMLSASGVLVPNDGTKPTVGFAPIGGVAPGQAFTPIGLDVVNVNTAAPYTTGTAYYMQANGTIGTTASAHYAGTAINGTTLIWVAKTAVDVAALYATPAPIDPILLDEGPAASTNKILTENSFRANASVAGTILAGVGSISYVIKPHGVHFNINLSTLPPNGFSGVIADLPAYPSGYLQYTGVFNDNAGSIGGMLYVIGGGVRIVTNATSNTFLGSQGFVEYA